MERQVIESKLLATREELSKAGPIHTKDLQKYIHRLERQLRIMNKVRDEQNTLEQRPSAGSKRDSEAREAKTADMTEGHAGRGTKGMKSGGATESLS